MHPARLLPFLVLVPACADLTAPGTDQSKAKSHPDPVPQAAAPAAKAEPNPGTERATAAHILIAYKGAARAQPNVTRDKEEARKMAENLLGRVKQGEDLATLAKNHSDDPAAKRTGGFLGTFDRTFMGKEFTDAAFALPVGGVSAVVESPFGFHIIKRLPEP